MTIRRGEPWGEPGPLAAGAPVFGTDREASRWLAAQLRDGRSGGAAPELGLVGGDLHATLGAPDRQAGDLRDGHGVRHPVDLVEVEWEDAAGARHRDVAVAHVVLRGRTWWRGRTVVVMNGGHLGAWDLGPRAHPNDGRLDVTDGSLGWQDRRAARRRAATGTHVPHPSLAERRVGELEVALDPPTGLWIDGEDVGVARTVTVRCLPDAAVVVA